VIPAYHGSLSGTAWALLIGPIAGLLSVLYVRAVAWADGQEEQGWHGLLAPVLALGLLGAVSIRLPKLLGNDGLTVTHKNTVRRRPAPFRKACLPRIPRKVPTEPTRSVT
jgi:H+/Cl- antiporter ClcA